MAAKTGATKPPGMAVDLEADSPANKRPCPTPSTPEGTPLTLELFQSTIQPLIAKISNLDTRLSQVDNRVGQVETAFTERMKEQVNLLAAITNTQSQHTNDLVALQQQDQLRQDAITSMQQRLAKLETNPPRQPNTSSTTTAEDRQPALIMGGWADDQDASTTLQLAKDTVARPKLDVDLEEAFVPGIRRGYLVIPYGPRGNETDGNMYSRLAAAIQTVRAARQATGAMNPSGQPKYLWLAYSQTPERRKRARYAGKVKRLLLEQVAEKDALRVEFATGAIWYQGRRVASATAPPPQGQPITKSVLGWMDADAVANYTHKSKEAITAAWQALLDPLLQQ